MLSILIPTYNFDITTLVKALHQQCKAASIPFEILCFDDGSTQNYRTKNQSISNLEKVNYKELPSNLGRAKIRNVLGKAAQYPYLLFMDCDSAVTNPQYIKNYITHVNPNTLLYGGRVYEEHPPKNYDKRLHYFHGKFREEILTEERKTKPYYSFMTNNFLIPKGIFLNFLFEESIKGYGHEDTLFGIALQKKHIKIQHLNNPLKHLGLEDQAVFLKKQQEAIHNIYQLHQKEGLKETKLLKTFVWCKKWKVSGIVYRTLKACYPIITQQLKAKQPKLFFLDLYKLFHLLELDKHEINHLPS